MDLKVFQLALFNKNQKEANKRGMIRWTILALSVALFFIASLKGELNIAIITFILGAIVGFFIDCLGVAKLKLWKYTKQEFLKKEYFFIVVPAWGALGMAVNLIWNWIKIPELILFAVITLSLFSLHEIPNLKTKSWEYRIPMRLVIIGWIPLILAYRIIFLLLL